MTNQEQGSMGRQELLALGPSWLAFAWLVSKAKFFWNHNPDLQFGWVVVLLCAYLLWEVWEKRPAPLFRWSILTSLLASSGCCMVLLVQVYQAAFGTNAASMVGLALGLLVLVSANLSYLYGLAGLRHFGLPFGFILVAMPMPSAVHNLVVGSLQSRVASLDVEILNVMGVPASRVGSLIQLPTCTVGIDEACSGIRSLQSAVMATIFIGYLTLKRIITRFALLVGGVFLAILGNVFRSLFLSLVAHREGVESLHRFHDAAGWSILAFTVVGVALLAWFFAAGERLLATSHVGATGNPQHPPPPATDAKAPPQAVG